MTHRMTTEMNQEMRECIQHCTECHNVCVETTVHCLQLGGKHVEAAHLRLLLND